MVLYIKERGRIAVAWYDGRLPSKRSLDNALRHLNLKRPRIPDSPTGVEDTIQTTRGDHIRCQLLAELLATCIDMYLDVPGSKTSNYEIAVLLPKWSKANRPQIVRWAERSRHNHERLFAEDDKLLRDLSPVDVLHVRPYIHGLREQEYCQIVSLHASPRKKYHYSWVAASQVPVRERTQWPLEELVRMCDLNPPDQSCYHNYPVFEGELRKQLSTLVDTHCAGHSVLPQLQSLGFRITAHRLVASR